MTKEVTVIIDGLQLGDEEGAVTVTVPGVYHQRGDKHFIQYDEKSDSGEGIIKNTIKIALNKIVITKTGVNTTQMVFDLMECTSACYQTPYGSLFLDIQTTMLQVEESLDELVVKLKYTLSTNGSHLSDNQIMISACSKI